MKKRIKINSELFPGLKVGDKVKMAKDIPSVNGMLYEGSIVKISDFVQYEYDKNYKIRVVNDIGKIWWVDRSDING